jgi:hypothetical protein
LVNASVKDAGGVAKPRNPLIKVALEMTERRYLRSSNSPDTRAFQVSFPKLPAEYNPSGHKCICGVAITAAKRALCGREIRRDRGKKELEKSPIDVMIGGFRDMHTSV